MKKTFFTLSALAAALLACSDASAQYYKDIFNDGGCHLTSRPDLPAARFLDLSIESFWCGEKGTGSKTVYTEADSLAQYEKMVGSKDDTNGCLLYPDGAPRFRVLYENGGHSAKHGISLTDTGLQRIRDFYAAGGSFVGTCAGAFISSWGGTDFDKKSGKCVEKQNDIQRKGFTGIYPARVLRTCRLTKEHWKERVYTGMKIEAGSPILKYYDFGGDMYIDSVYHNGGCFITTDPQHFVPGTEILLRYDFDKDDIRVKEGDFAITDHISAWAWKKDASTGRIVNCGSHPEGITYGERLELFSSFVRYALDGLGTPKIKGELRKGKVRRMDKTTEECNPAYTRIGDRQYHHFIVNIPRRVKNVTVTLECAAEGIDMNLMMNRDDFAFRKNAQYQNVSLGANKELRFKSLEKGTYYIAVECATAVEEEPNGYGFKYTGHTEVLNGIPYTIAVDWK